MRAFLSELSRAVGFGPRGGVVDPSNLCGICRHFRNDAAYLERAIPGLSSLSSATASVRADDGICELRGMYLSARASCAEFDVRE